MKIISLTYKNLLSSGNNPITIDFTKNQMTLVVGENGCGKSTPFLDGVSFGLYGKSFREINKGDLVNSINKKECVVEIVFEKNGDVYKVYRGIKPNIFMIYKNDIKVNEESSSSVQQAYLQDIIGIEYEAFKQIVVLGNSNYVPFMKLKTTERRKFIEDILNMQVYAKMLDIAKLEYKEVEKTYSKLQLESSNLRNLISTKTHNLKMLTQKSKHDSSKYDVLIKSVLEKINKSREELSKIDIKVRKAKYDEFNNTLTILNNQNLKLSHSNSSMNDVTSFLSKNEQCPTCDQVINSEFKKNKIESINQEVNKNNIKINQMNEFVTSTKTKMKSLNEDIEKYNSIKHIIMTDVGNLKLYQEQKKSFIEDQNTFIDLDKEQNELVKLNEDLLNLDFDKVEAETEIERYRTIIKCLNDKGLKQEIVKQYVPIINEKVNQYLIDMNFYVEFTIDENFKETIKARRRDECSYNNFSEGERKRIDLALMFTWRDVMNSIHATENINLLVLDEILDSSLDSNGIEDFMGILSKLDKSNIFIISHRQDASLESFQEIIKFSKVDGFSEISFSG